MKLKAQTLEDIRIERAKIDLEIAKEELQAQKLQNKLMEKRIRQNVF